MLKYKKKTVTKKNNEKKTMTKKANQNKNVKYDSQNTRNINLKEKKTNEPRIFIWCGVNQWCIMSSSLLNVVS